jgi:hypothetical protein
LVCARIYTKSVVCGGMAECLFKCRTSNLMIPGRMGVNIVRGMSSFAFTGWFEYNRTEINSVKKIVQHLFAHFFFKIFSGHLFAHLESFASFQKSQQKREGYSIIINYFDIRFWLSLFSVYGNTNWSKSFSFWRLRPIVYVFPLRFISRCSSFGQN